MYAGIIFAIEQSDSRRFLASYHRKFTAWTVVSDSSISSLQQHKVLFYRKRNDTAVVVGGVGGGEEAHKVQNPCISTSISVRLYIIDAVIFAYHASHTCPVFSLCLLSSESWCQVSGILPRYLGLMDAGRTGPRGLPQVTVTDARWSVSGEERGGEGGGSRGEGESRQLT